MNSTEIKTIKGKGGARVGAGRKPKAVTQPFKDIAADVLKSINLKEKWIALINCGEPRVIKDTLVYLTDRVHGKPAQAVTVQGDKDKPLEVLIRIIGVGAN